MKIIARLSFHLGAVAFGVLATTTCCFVFSATVLLHAAPAAQLSPLAATLTCALLALSAFCGLPATLRVYLPWLLRQIQPPQQPSTTQPDAYPVGEGASKSAPGAGVLRNGQHRLLGDSSSSTATR